jgi:UDP-glucose 4-epimerase
MAKVLWMTQVFNAPPVYLDFLRYICVADTRKMKRQMGFRPRYNIQQIVADFAGARPTVAEAPIAERS